MKALITTGSLLLTTGLIVFQPISAIPTPDKIVVCDSNPKFFYEHWNKLNGQHNVRVYHKCTTPFTSSVGTGSCPSITQIQYVNGCKKEAIHVPAQPALPPISDRDRPEFTR